MDFLNANLSCFHSAGQNFRSHIDQQTLLSSLHVNFTACKYYNKTVLVVVSGVAQSQHKQ